MKKYKMAHQLEPEQGGFYMIREKEVLKIKEEEWRPNSKFTVKTRVDNRVISDKYIVFWTRDKELLFSVALQLAPGVDPSIIAGGAAVSLRRPGAKSFSKMVDHLAEFKQATTIGQQFNVVSQILQVDFDAERFLKDFLIEGSLVVEVETELRVGTAVITRDQVANNYIDVKAFFSATSDLVVVCKGEEMPASRALLAARSPTFAAGLGPFKEG